MNEPRQPLEASTDTPAAGTTPKKERAARAGAKQESMPGRDTPAMSATSPAASQASSSGQGTTSGTSTAGAGGEGHGFVGRLRDRAGEQINTQKGRALDSIGTVAQAVRATTRELRGQQHGVIAEYVERAADQLDRFSDRLEDKDVGDLYRDAQAMARRRPMMFIGTAFAIGLVGARFFKSSAPNGNPPARDWRRLEGGTPMPAAMPEAGRLPAAERP